MKLEKIELTFDQFAYLVEIVREFIGTDHNTASRLTEKALDMTEIPPDAIIEVSSGASTIEDAIDEYWNEKEGSVFEKAAIRRAIELAETREMFDGLVLELLHSTQEDDFENLLAIRKLAQICL